MLTEGSGDWRTWSGLVNGKQTNHILSGLHRGDNHALEYTIDGVTVVAKIREVIYFLKDDLIDVDFVVMVFYQGSRRICVRVSAKTFKDSLESTARVSGVIVSTIAPKHDTQPPKSLESRFANLKVEYQKVLEVSDTDRAHGSVKVPRIVFVVGAQGAAPTLVGSKISGTKQFGLTATITQQAGEGQGPCESWSTCIVPPSTGTDLSKCANYASSCSSLSTASANQELTFYELRLSPLATSGIKLYPMVKGDVYTEANAARYGRDPGTSPSDATTLYVVVPVGERKDGQKGKVLVIPPTAKDATVRDATLRSEYLSIIWTIDTQAVPEPTDKQTPPGTNDKKTPETMDKKTPETTSEPPCDDLVECATTATTLTFSSCAVQAVACESNRPKDLVQTDSLTHGDEKGIKLYPLTDEVLYGTDTVNAYVVLVRKEKVLVAPRDNKTDAAVLDVAKEGTVWTSKTGLSTIALILIGVGSGIAFILLVVVLFFVTRSSDNKADQGYTELRHADRGYDYDSSYADAVQRFRPRIRRPLADSGVPTTASTTTTTAAAAAQGPKAL
jgi:hypothetical protein